VEAELLEPVNLELSVSGDLTLSPPGEAVEFPISKTEAFPRVNELMDIVKYLP
jgi:hypothetical protein